MPINQPYDPRYNAKLYIPKLTEEERRARATPLENLRGLRFRSQAPAAPVEVPTPAESVPQAPAPQDTAAPEKVPVSAPAPHYVPTALEVVSAEFPEIFAPTTNGQCQSPSAAADGNPEATRNEIGDETGSPPVMPYEENDILACSNVISFYSRPRRNATAPKAIHPRSGCLSFATSLIPHHSSG